MASALSGRAAEHRSQALTADLVARADLILPAARDHRPSILELEPTSRVRTFTIRQAGRIADWMVDSGMVAGGGGAWAGADRWAGPRSAAWGGDPVGWAAPLGVGDPPQDVQALPHDPAGRWRWVVSEMDAARGLVGGSALGPRPWRGLRPLSRGGGGGGGAIRGGLAGRAPASSLGGLGTASGGQGAVNPSALHADDVPDPHYLGAGLHPLAYDQLVGSTDALVRLLREVGAVPG